MKYSFLFCLTLGTIIATLFGAAPCNAQFTSFPSSSSDSCANFCIKLDIQSASTNSGLDSFGFNNGSLNSNNGGIRLVNKAPVEIPGDTPPRASLAPEVIELR